MMHELIYDQLTEAKIAIEHSEAKMHDEQSNIVEEESSMIGLPTKYKLQHPDYLLMVDKVGSNLHCNNNNNVHGEKYILCVSSYHATMRSNNNDCRFTILDFVSRDRKSVMCVVIIKSEQLTYEQIQGIGLNVPLVAATNIVKDIKMNSGPGKRYSGGPVCEFKEKDTLCVVTCSSGGSINQFILM